MLAGVRDAHRGWLHRLRDGGRPALSIVTPQFPDASMTSPPGERARPARRVAVCDDDLRFIRFIERAFLETGATVQPVTTLDPEEAVRVIAATACDTALIDLRMYNDDLAGLTIASMLRADPTTHDIRMRIATCAPRDLRRYDDTLRALRCEVLPKPFSIDDLFASLGMAQSQAA